MTKKYTSKFFRVALEGATTDGRKIERSWIEQMAKNFDPIKYGARIWMEHIRGTLPDSQFRAYGDVKALKAEEVTIDGVKKLGLYAQIEPTPDLVTMTKAKQKIYTSIEINEKFADSGEAYLVGLGVTDSPPASVQKCSHLQHKTRTQTHFRRAKQAPAICSQKQPKSRWNLMKSIPKSHHSPARLKTFSAASAPKNRR
jgi:hypothetical protein